MTADCHPGSPTKRVTILAADLRGDFSFSFAAPDISPLLSHYAAPLPSFSPPLAFFKCIPTIPFFADMGNYSPGGFWDLDELKLDIPSHARQKKDTLK